MIYRVITPPLPAAPRSDEDLIKRILADGQLQLCDAQQLFSQPGNDLADL